MDAFDLFFSTQGRLDRRTFGWCVVAVYLAGFFSQALLTGSVMARAGLWPFVAVQAALIWAWLAIHIKRLRDANEGPAGAIGVAIVYSLAVGLLLLVVALFSGFVTHGTAIDRPPGEPASPSDTLVVMFLIFAVFSMLYSPDAGMFASLVKIMIAIACLPPLISFVFSLVTGLRKSAPPTPLPPQPQPAPAPPLPAP